MAFFFGTEVGAADGYHTINAFQKIGAFAKIIQRSGLDEAFKGTPPHLCQVYAVDKVGNVGEGLVAAPREDYFNRRAPHIFDRTQRKPNGGLAVGLVFNGEIPAAVVHIGLQYVDAHALAVGGVEGNFVGVVFVDRHLRGHVFRRVVGFEEGRFDRYQAVSRGMALVEAVAGETFPVIENGFGDLAINAVFYRPFHKLFMVLGNFVFLLFCNGLAELVGLRGFVTRHVHCQEHDLLLVNRNAVSLG